MCALYLSDSTSCFSWFLCQLQVAELGKKKNIRQTECMKIAENVWLALIPNFQRGEWFDMLENMWPISFSHLGFGSWTVPNTVCWLSECLQHTEPRWRPARNYFSSSQFTLQRSTVRRRSTRAWLAALTEVMGIGSRTTGSFQQSHFLQRVKNVFYIAYFMFVYWPISSCSFTAKTSFAHICFSADNTSN